MSFYQFPLLWHLTWTYRKLITSLVLCLNVNYENYIFLLICICFLELFKIYSLFYNFTFKTKTMVLKNKSKSPWNSSLGVNAACYRRLRILGRNRNTGYTYIKSISFLCGSVIYNFTCKFDGTWMSMYFIKYYSGNICFWYMILVESYTCIGRLNKKIVFHY